MKNQKSGLSLAAIALVVFWGGVSPLRAQQAACDPNNPPTITTSDPALDSASNKDSDKIHGVNKVGQIFKVEGSGCFRISEVTVRIRRHDHTTGGPTPTVTMPSNLVVSIFGTATGGDGGKIPNSTLLGFEQIATTSVPTTYAALNIVFDPPVEVAGGSYYAVVFSEADSAGGGSRYYEVRRAATDVYLEAGLPNNLRYCKYDGTTWACPNNGGGQGFDVLMFIELICCAQGCTYSQGYWKNHGGDHPAVNPHPDAWPAAALPMSLGTQPYTHSELLEILRQSVQGNGLVSLAHQLIAAKLNAAYGAPVPAAVQQAINDADTLIGSLVVPPIGQGFLSPSDTGSLTGTLDLYNQGLWPGGPLHCEDTD